MSHFLPMKTLLNHFVIAATALGLAAFAHAGAPEVLTDFEAAKAKAAESNKPILLEFTGSDWCPPCMQMKADVLSTETFQEFAAENVVFVELDFPQGKEISKEQKKHNEGMARKYRVQGFPTFVLVDSKGKELARTVGYTPGGPSAFISWIKENS